MSTTSCLNLSASSLTGDSIKNSSDDKLGTVHDIMLDCASGKVSYVVMSSGGFLGFGDKLFAIPMSALEVDTDDKCLRMNASKETFEESDGFNQDNWPNFADRTWEEHTHKRYSASPYWT